MRKRKHHISEDGEVRACKANLRDCKYSTRGDDHYESVELARAVYEEKLRSIRRR